MSTAQAAPPTEIDVALRSAADTGVFELLLLPLPSAPLPPYPQHFTRPPLMSAQVVADPAESAAAPLRPVTTTGTLELALAPLPSEPLLPLPQHFTVALESKRTQSRCQW